MLTDEEMQAWEGDRFSSRIESMGPHAEPVPALSSAQTTATEMTLFSELPRQDLPALMPSHPAVPTQNAPLVSVMNLSPRSIPTSTSHPPAPNPDVIRMMTHADPTIQNVDSTLIAMNIPGTHLRQAGVAPIEAPLSQSPRALSGSKRRWKDVITPLSYEASTSKKPRKQRKSKHSQNTDPAA